jgi:hypothetical protein
MRNFNKMAGMGMKGSIGVIFSMVPIQALFDKRHFVAMYCHISPLGASYDNKDENF